MEKDLLVSNPFSLLTFIAAPAILTSATSVLASSTVTRMLRVYDRMHELFIESEGRPRIAAEVLVSQAKRLNAQAELILGALRWIYAALAGFAAASLSTLLGAVSARWGGELLLHTLVIVGLSLGVLAVTGLVCGCLDLLRTTRLSLAGIEQEADLICARQMAQGPSPGDSPDDRAV